MASKAPSKIEIMGELRAAEQQREELTTLLVHDLKNPLSNILAGASFLAQEADLGEEAGECVQEIHQAAESLQRMVLNLLDIGRSEDGALALQLAELDLSALIEQVLAATSRRAGEAERRFVVSGDRLPKVRADQDILRRVLENLFDNALRFAPPHSAIRLDARSGEGAVEVRIRDEGPGISAAYREKIFEKYVQLEPAFEGQTRTGRGLGLLFCRLAIEAHGGRIWVEENQPQGSSFCIRLPLGGPG
jgi:signal transduction histidine kinase